MAQNTVRLDKWLWAARFFKTRALAAEAVSGGKVHVDGTRSKPARAVGIGNHLKITKGVFTFDVIVSELSEKRGPATVAQTLYSETDESKRQRTALSEQLRLNKQYVPRPDHRPDKRDRRKLLKQKGKN